MSRTETREERYLNKMAGAAKYPFAVAACNFSDDANIAYLSRSLACFGGDSVHVIGKVPDNKTLTKYSGTMNRFLKFFNYKNPAEFIDYCRKENYTIIPVELTDDAISVHDIIFGTGKIMFVLGNESNGVPVEILTASALKVYIPMPGFGYCLNTSQAANVICYEYARQMAK